MLAHFTLLSHCIKAALKRAHLNLMLAKGEVNALLLLQKYLLNNPSKKGKVAIFYPLVNLTLYLQQFFLSVHPKKRVWLKGAIHLALSVV